MKRLALVSVRVSCCILVLGVAGCSDTATTAPTSTGNATTTTATTTTATTTTMATTTESGPDYPTYAEYLAELPPGTETCDSRGTVSDMGNGLVSVGGPASKVSIVDGELVVFCPGAELVVGESFNGVNQNGEPLEEGDLFSVDPDGSFVQLSNF